MYAHRSHVTYLLLPHKQVIRKSSLHKAASALRSALEGEEMIVCNRPFLEFKLDEGNVIPGCEFVSHPSLFFVKTTTFSKHEFASVLN